VLLLSFDILFLQTAVGRSCDSRSAGQLGTVSLLHALLLCSIGYTRRLTVGYTRLAYRPSQKRRKTPNTAIPYVHSKVRVWNTVS